MSVHAAKRSVEDFNADWKFNLGDAPEALAPAFDDSAWRGVTLPHDWSVELSFTQENAGGCTAFLPGGIGWYRKTFTVPESSKGRVVRIDFDGVYSNSEVWINGHHLGMRPFGYIPFSYNLSDYLNYGGENAIVVRADRTAYMDCRWYPGSGIYRDVTLVTHDPVYIEQHGLFVTTKDNKEAVVQAALVNGSDVEQSFFVNISVQDAGAFSVITKLAPGERKVVEKTFELDNPKLWDTENPHLYRAEVNLGEDGDGASTTFGVREIRYDAAEGFFLNEKNTLIKGVCLHHDGGCVGAAVPDGVWERRLRILKEGGCNAIRTAHNPPSEAFLDLCDRMGFLVQDEVFDEWQNPKDKKHNFNQRVEDERTFGYARHFDEWCERDTKAMVLRDRNHPSIIMWSIGNEIEWTYPGYGGATGYWEKDNNVNYYWDEPPFSAEELKARYTEEEQGEHVLADTANDLSRWVKEVDTSRPVTANLVMPSISHFSGYTDALDIVGYSYRTVLNEWGHRHYPEKMILGTENWVQWNEWKGVLDNSHIPGIFLWTGINYLGESLNWPQKANDSGMLDTAGFRKPNYWFFKTLWKENEPMVYIASQPLEDSNYLFQEDSVVENPDKRRTRKWGWPDLSNRWNYKPGEEVYVELYSNCEETELFLNGKSLGIQSLEKCDDRLMKWVVPFEPGTLKAVGRSGGKETASLTLETAGEPAAIKLAIDKPGLNADGEDVVHCVAQLVDAEGRPVKHVDHLVRFIVEGDAHNVGVDNGSTKSTQDFQSDTCRTDEGRCLMVLQAGRVPGPLKVTAFSEGLTNSSVEIVQK